MLRTPLKIEWLLLAGLCLGLTGCPPRMFQRDPFAVTASCQISDEMTPHELVRHLNDRGASKLHSWQANSVKVSSPSMPISPTASLAVEAPRNFRMTAHVLAGIDEVDLGSNQERFWFWTKQTNRPCILTARHEQTAIAQQKLSIPFQPEWIIEALGVIPLDEQDVQLERLPQQPRGRKLGRLISKRVSSQGEPVKKVTTVDLCHGIILEHALYDSRGQIIARAGLSEHHFETATGAVVPNRIDLEWPQMKMSMTLSLGRIQVNPQISPQMFTMQPRPNTPIIDLGKSEPGTAQAPARPHHAPVALSSHVESDDELPEEEPAARSRVGQGSSVPDFR
jgi:hypothetical protein